MNPLLKLQLWLYGRRLARVRRRTDRVLLRQRTAEMLALVAAARTLGLAA